MVKSQLAARGVDDHRVLAAMARVPRHRFVPGRPLTEAYADRALPIAEGQTISQPYIVAHMTQLLRVEPGMRVLEIGTGSGYQAAVLLEMGAKVDTIERHAPLAEAARKLLADLYPEGKWRVTVGDGSAGLPQHAPFDRIIVTAGAPDVPAALRDQLADGGRLVIPTGPRDAQLLMLCERRGDAWRESHDCGCRFVPLLGEHGWHVPGA